MDRKDRIESLKKAIRERILLLDGAMGTTLQIRGLTANDFGGEALEGCNENLVLTCPELIQGIHESYLEAGSDIIETNTFGGTPLVLAEYGLEKKTEEINQRAAQIARAVADKYTTPDRPRFVAGTMGPTTKVLSLTGGATFDELVENFYIQAKALFEGGVDYFLLETAQDTRNVKAGLVAIDRLSIESCAAGGARKCFGGSPTTRQNTFDVDRTRPVIPIAVSGTIEPSGSLLAGQSVEAFVTSLDHRKLLYIGLNCATGPEFMTDPIRSMSHLARVPIACVPNAGLPDVDGNYLETPEMLASHFDYFAKSGWVNVIGGCCGTTPSHIRALRRIADTYPPRKIPIVKGSYLSGIDFLEVTAEKRPILVGERTNVYGSREFKGLIEEGKFEEASEIARQQVKKGAAIIDICLANPERDESADMTRFLEHVIQKIRVPLMIDSINEEVIAKALTYSQGKAIINSINLEEGEQRFEKIAQFIHQFGAAVVVGMIDEDPDQGMAITRERKLEIAKRSYDLLVNKYDVRPEDIYFDPLVFPCGTGDEKYKGSAIETIEGIRSMKKAFPLCKTVIGVSNVSFGLPPLGREVLNSVFLHRCVEAGLDLAIVNTEIIRRFLSIPKEEKKLSEDLMINRGGDPIGVFANYFREKKITPQKEKEKRPLKQRLASHIIDATKENLQDNLEEALKTMGPLEIINGPLMQGMDEVGRLFNKNELIVAEVLQSAEVMKAAVDYLETHMDKLDEAIQGTLLLATVKGDVHDIGKNLVDIIFSNNAFKVINLGIKIPPEKIIEAVKEHKPDIIGLSGLLVKSAEQMVMTAKDLKTAGISLPLLVGGAALSKKFTDTKIASTYKGIAIYAKDAMNGLKLAKKILKAKGLETLKDSLKIKNTTPLTSPMNENTTRKRSQKIEILKETPTPPDLKRHVICNTPIEELWAYINPRMLYGYHLGLRGSTIDCLQKRGIESAETNDEEKKALDLVSTVEAVKQEYSHTFFKPKAIYQFFLAKSQGNKILIFDETKKQILEFSFPRQKDEGLCLSDYILPLERDFDSLCLFITTVTDEIREKAKEWKEKGEYLKSHILHVLAIETAEAYAEWLHAKIRGQWGFADDKHMTMQERFQAKYRGKRYSFGYAACPEMENQKILFDLLKPEEIGVQLTEGYMMDPEASVSAMVFHHPQCTYFSV